MMQLTNQQLNFLDTCKNHSLVLIYALAGCGKTTLLFELSRISREKKGIYIVFNRSNKEEARAKFPKNIKVVNLHSLAYGCLKRHGKYSLNNVRRGNYKEAEIARILNIKLEDAKNVNYMFNKYLNSSLPELKGTKFLVLKVKEFYEKMKNEEIAMTDNFYLKEFSLMLKNKEIKLEYDFLMLDEAQDTNMVSLFICNSIVAKNKIFVGDDNQQIYSFRDSVNALDKLKNPKIFYLTNTFRFPKYICDWANKVLAFKGSEIFLESNIEVDDRFDLYKKDSLYCEEIEREHEQRCYIARTNSVILEKMIDLIRMNRVFKTVRNPEEIFSLVEEVYYISIFAHEKICRNTFLLNYKNMDKLEEYAKKVDDVELLSAIAICNKYEGMILTLKGFALKYYDDYNINPGAYKDFLTTAHTCKGLEWDYVCVMDSFTDFIRLLVKSECISIQDFRKNIKNIDSKIVDEINLFYVAMTRAKKSMEVLDENAFYLDLEDWEINTLILEYKKALDNCKKGIAQFIEFNPREILGYEEDELEVNTNIDENTQIVIDNSKAIEEKSSVQGFCGKGRFSLEQKSIEEIKKEVEEKKLKIKKQNDFVDFYRKNESWGEFKVSENILQVNGIEVDKEVTVGVRVGNGVRVHPMKATVVDEKLVISNNTKWKESDLTIIDLIENIPENLIAGKLKK